MEQPAGTVDVRRYRRLSPPLATMVWQTRRGELVATYDQVGDFLDWPSGAPPDWGYGNQQHTNGLLSQDLFGPGPVVVAGREAAPDGFLILRTRSFDGDLRLTDEEWYDGYQDSPLFLFFGHNVVENDCGCHYKNHRYDPPVQEDGRCQSTVTWFVPPVPGPAAGAPPPLVVRYERYREAYEKDENGGWVYGPWTLLSEYFGLDRSWTGSCGYDGIVAGDGGYTLENNATQAANA